ncbi:hypothetical protein PABG_12204 [Paracoccidioides brasiliensis Pb03]|nr:hypothetical protein PABG_12204 [Paracoccidioides brasiliensis Pb03]
MAAFHTYYHSVALVLVIRAFRAQYAGDVPRQLFRGYQLKKKDEENSDRPESSLFNPEVGPITISYRVSHAEALFSVVTSNPDRKGELPNISRKPNWFISLASMDPKVSGGFSDGKEFDIKNALEKNGMDVTIRKFTTKFPGNIIYLLQKSPV